MSGPHMMPLFYDMSILNLFELAARSLKAQDAMLFIIHQFAFLLFDQLHCVVRNSMLLYLWIDAKE